MMEIVTMLALAVWMVTVEIRLARLYAYNDFLEDRVVDVDARTCILEGRKNVRERRRNDKDRRFSERT